MWAWACLVLLKYYVKQNKSSRVIQPFTPWGDDTYLERRFGKPAGGGFIWNLRERGSERGVSPSIRAGTEEHSYIDSACSSVQHEHETEDGRGKGNT
jgi:hypothetical protein